MRTAILTISVEQPDGSYRPVDGPMEVACTGDLANPTARVLGDQATRVARFYRDATDTTANVAARLEVPGGSAGTGYAVTPDPVDLPLSQHDLLMRAYGLGALVLPDGDLTAEALVDLGLLHRAGLVHGHLAGRQYRPAGPYTLRWYAYRQDPSSVDGWTGVGSGFLRVPGATVDWLDRAVHAVAVRWAEGLEAVVRVAATLDGTILTAFDTAAPPLRIVDHPA